MTEFLPWFIIIPSVFFMLRYFYDDCKNIINNKAPKDFRAVIVSIGVLGTFAGILIGLLKFDSENISDSVPLLLEGLKTAFGTSVLGLLLSIIIGVTLKAKGITEANSELDVLNSINTNIGKIEENLNSNHTALEKFLTSEMETINNSLSNAVEKLGQGATTEIIKALENVITDFNKNLTEQFGDNFKQLNESVKNMIEWQEKYKLYVDNQQEKLDITIANSAQIIKNQEEFTASSDKLKEIIATNENQINNIQIHLQTLKIISDDAQEITDSIKNFSDEIKNSLNEQINSVSDQTKSIQGLVRNLTEVADKDIPESLGHLNRTLTTLTNKFAEDYNSFLVSIKQLQDDAKRR